MNQLREVSLLISTEDCNEDEKEMIQDITHDRYQEVNYKIMGREYRIYSATIHGNTCSVSLMEWCD